MKGDSDKEEKKVEELDKNSRPKGDQEQLIKQCEKFPVRHRANLFPDRLTSQRIQGQIEAVFNNAGSLARND